jgi:hypothetical protein
LSDSTPVLQAPFCIRDFNTLCEFTLLADGVTSFGKLAIIFSLKGNNFVECVINFPAYTHLGQWAFAL